MTTLSFEKLSDQVIFSWFPPVDFAGNKFSPKVTTIEIDLAWTEGRQLASELVDNVHPDYHVGRAAEHENYQLPRN